MLYLGIGESSLVLFCPNLSHLSITLRNHNTTSHRKSTFCLFKLMMPDTAPVRCGRPPLAQPRMMGPPQIPPSDAPIGIRAKGRRRRRCPEAQPHRRALSIPTQLKRSLQPLNPAFDVWHLSLNVLVPLPLNPIRWLPQVDYHHQRTLEPLPHMS